MTKPVVVSASSWRLRAKGLADTLLNFVFPPVCVTCKKAGSLLCADCYGRIQWLSEPLCPRCGRITSKPVTVCHVCQKRPLPLTQVRAAVLFADPIPKIIHNFKYNGMFGLDKLLATMMADAWPQWETAVDLIIPVSMHPTANANVDTTRRPCWRSSLVH